MVETLLRDQNSIPVAGGVSSTSSSTVLPFKVNSATGRLLTDSASGSGTVTDVSVATANGFAGSVATSTTTPVITISTTVTGLLLGNGTSVSAATTTGSGAVVLANTPTLITPNIGAATGTSLTVTGALYSQTSLVLEETGAGTDTVTIQVPSSIAASYTLTLPVDDGNSGEVLSTNGSGVLSWVSAGGVPTTITVADETTDTSCFIAFFTAATGDLGPKTNANLTFNSNTGVLTAGQVISGSISGNAVTTTAADEASDTTCFITFATAATGAVGTKTNANMTFNSSTGVATFASTVLTTTAIAGGTINATIIGGSTPAAGTFTTVVGNSFVPNANTVPSNGMYLPAANTLGWAVNSAAELQLTATALSPAADGGSSLGTTALGWQNLFANTGFVINIENSDWVATHTAGILTVGTGDLRVTNNFTNATSVVTVGGAQTLTSKVLTAATITTSLVPTSNDGAALGSTTNQFSDLFLAEGGVINFDNGDLTLTQTGNELVLAGGNFDVGAGNILRLTNSATMAFTVPTTDLKATGPTTADFVSGYSSTAVGDLVILDSSGKWQKTDANTSSIYNGMLGIALTIAAADAAVTVALPGAFVYSTTGFPTFTIGATLYMSETAGAITATAPTTTDAATRIIGYAVHADKIFFYPDGAWITHT